jgi:hypothetical protein
MEECVFVGAGDVQNFDDFRSGSGSEGDPRVVHKVAEYIVAECDVESCDRLAEKCGRVDSLVVILGKDVGERLNPETESLPQVGPEIHRNFLGGSISRPRARKGVPVVSQAFP